MGVATKQHLARRLLSEKKHGEYLRTFAVAAAFVFVGVAVLLMRNGIALTKTTQVLDCPVTGTVAHTHDATCYDEAGTLVCPLPEQALHVHGDACYTETRTLTCTLPEHTHTDACYEEGVLTCGLAEHVHTDACYELSRELTCGQEEIAEEHVHGPGCFRTVLVEEGTEEAPVTDDADVLQDDVLPAQSFRHEFTERSEDGSEHVVLAVSVDAPEGALPAGTTMQATWVAEQDLTAKQQQAVEQAVAAKVDGRICDQQAVDLTFVDAEGNEVEPALPVVVTFTSELLQAKDRPVVVHIDDLTEQQLRDQAKALAKGKKPAQAEPDRVAQTVDELDEQALEEHDLALAQDELAFESDRFSTYVLAMTTLKHTMRAKGATVTVTAKAPAEAGIPADAVLRVNEVGQGAAEYDAYMAGATQALGAEDWEVAFARFFDITIEDGEGNEIQPAEPVEMRITLTDAPTEADAEAGVVHFDSATGTPEVVAAREDAGTARFDAAGFSVYGVVYTVDFHWEADGREYAFSIAGGDTLSLSELLRVLEVVSPDEQLAFMGNVADVTFSDPTLIHVAKVEADITAGALKQELGLQPVYSVDLSAERRAEMDAKQLAAGDWALVSLQAFDTEEALTITLTDGQTLVIRVTDEQPNNPFGLGGQTFVIANEKWGTKSALTASLSDGVLAGTNIGNSTTAGNNLRWTFEYTETGTEFLVHDQQGRYLVIGSNNGLSLASREVAAANPIVVTYDNARDRYSFRAKNSNVALNNYGGRFGGYAFDANNQDNWMQLLKPNDLGKPGTIATADTRAEGITINLFDYGPDSLDAETNNNDTNYADHAIVEEGINQGHPLKFVSHGCEGTSMNHYTGGTNEGGSTGATYKAMQGIVKPALSGGYPVLTGYNTTQGSLQYLFDPSTSFYGKTVYGDVNHLFVKDEKGFYRFDSNKNYAYYDTGAANASRDFTVYASTFNEEGTVRDEKVGFFPFNDYDSYYNCIHGGEPNVDYGFAYYSPHRVNNEFRDLDKLGHYDHHFGMSMTADFVMTRDGTYNGEDMTFHFSGDDDMWVFVDGVLVLDIGGIHNPVSGSINFRTGAVEVSGAMTVQGQNGAQAGPTSLQQAFSRVTGKDWDSTPYSTHKLQVFYLERGGMYSNCEIEFNLPTYKTLSLSKRLTGLTDAERARYKDEEFHYEVVVNNELYNGSDTVRFDAGGNIIEAGFAIVDGQVSIKDGETVTIAGLHRTDTFYAAEEKSLNMEQFEAPHAERIYQDSNLAECEEEVKLTAAHAQGADLDDWKTPTYQLENTEKVTFTNTLKEKNLEVDKKWEGEGSHPNQVTFTLSASVDDGTGKLVPYAVSVLKEADGTTDKQFTLSASGNWHTAVEHLPVHTPDGKLIVYDVKEARVEGYTSTARDITAETYNYCDVDVVKLWPDGLQHDEVITVRLKNSAGKYYAGEDAQGNPVFNAQGRTYDLKRGNGFTHRFARLPYDDTYTVEQVADQDDHTKGLVTYVRNIIQYELVNTPVGPQVDPEGPQDNPVIHKRIDALRDGATNLDSPHTGEDLTDLYRLYLDYKVKSLQEANGVDLLFVIDHSGSMNSNYYQGNQYRARSVMEALNGNDGVIAQFLDMNKDGSGETRNRWAAVGFKGDYGEKYIALQGFQRVDSGYRRSNAGAADSEVLSGASDDYSWKSGAANISLPLESTGMTYDPRESLLPFENGATVLTDYTAGFWRAEQFLLQDDVINDGRKKAIVFISDGIPTLHIPGVAAQESLVGADQMQGSQYYPDSEGGCPDEAKAEFGYFINDLQNSGYELGNDLEFYTIGFGGMMSSESGQNLLKGMLQIAYGDDAHEGNFMTIDDIPGTGRYSSTAANKLKDDLRTIMGMNETFTNIVIQDDLSRYVDLCELEGESDPLKAAKAKVTMTVPDPQHPDDASKATTVTLYENGAASTDPAAQFTRANHSTAPIIKRLEYDSATKTVKAVFDPEYQAQAGVTYTLSFDVKATDEAYETYESSGYDTYTSGEHEGQVITGDADTDFLGTTPANATSSGKPGFHSNDEAKTTYKHNGTDEEKKYPHPVIQVSATVDIVKVDETGAALEGATFNLYDSNYDPSKDAAANAEHLLEEGLLSAKPANEPNGDAIVRNGRLGVGTYYLVETDAPDGYYLLASPVKITVAANDDGTLNVAAEIDGTSVGDKLVRDATKKGLWKLTVQNTSGKELPNAGGPGTLPLQLVGTALVVSGLVAYVTRRRWA